MALACPRCGNKETLGTFCKQCLRELHPLVAGVRPGKLTLCAECDSAFIQGAWRRFGPDEAVTKVLSGTLEFSPHAVIKSVEFGEAHIERKPGIKKKEQVLAVVTGRHEDVRRDYEEEYDVPLHYEVTICPHCSRAGTAYYEGILQIRNPRPEVEREIRAYLREHRSKGVHLTKEVPVAKGNDYYLTDHRAIGHVARKLHAQFGGELKVNAQHFSENKQQGRILYRTNAYLELPDYGKGDVIYRDGTYYYILGVARKVTAENLLTGQQETFPYHKGESRRLPIRNTQVTGTDPVEVLHPQTYQAVEPQSSKFAPAELEIDRPVSVAYDQDHLFLIPDTFERDEVKQLRRRLSQKRTGREKG